MSKSDNTQSTDKKKRKAPRSAWKPGQSGNLAGAPKRGESWAELIKQYSDMTPEEIATKASSIAGQLKKIGGGISMKEAVIIRIFAALMFEPSSSLWKELMERTDGKVPQPVTGTGKDGALVIESKGIDDERFARAVETLTDAVREGLSGKGSKPDSPLGPTK
jgi:hypothetical protein